MRQFVHPSPSLQSCASSFRGGGIGACTHRNDQTINESLNGVNRQPSKKFIFYRQSSKMQIDTVKKFPGISILLFFPISADRHGLLAPEESSSKLENQFPCSQKHSFQTLQDLRTCLYLKIFPNFICGRQGQPLKHNS